MHRRPQIALMASLMATSFLSLSMLFSAMPAHAQPGAEPVVRAGAITPTTDESGRKIYVNEDKVNGDTTSAASRTGAAPARSPLVYWSSTEHRFKPVPTNGAVMRAARSAASEVNTYLDGKAQTHQILNRAFTQEDIDAAIEQAATRHNVDPSLVRSVVKVESDFNPNAVSRKGAMGLMQLMPSTARSLNVSNPFDPVQNVDAGVRHLRNLLDNYRGNVQLSLAAYNAGAGAVSRSAGVPHFRETQNYVRRITNLYNGGSETIFGNRAHEPVHVERDARGVLYISNTE
ncbi:MAG TPA: lytic transglycosylase domain-containing protein [Terriglobales bacterium]|nr:lytic transglycosylase domain-containing protein [Terriglobales bacterium]